MSDSILPRLLCFPGIAADERLFDRQREAFPDLLVAPWIASEPRESMVSYVGRQLDALNIDAGAVRAGDAPPIIPFGQSFGGWLAIAAAAHLDAPLAIVIANAPVEDAISAAMKKKVAAFTWMPAWAVLWFAWGFKAQLAVRCAIEKRPPRDIARTALGFPAKLLLWSGDVMNQPMPKPPTGCRVLRGYARHDPVVRYDQLPAGHDADLVVESDSHIFNHENADVFNPWLAERLAEAAAPSEPRA